MAIVDVVRCEFLPGDLVRRFPSCDLRLGSQLVVHPGQVAIFVKGGKVLDTFESGTYTLKTSNIPILCRLINIPFGGNSPFQAEVWFVNMTCTLDAKWGTSTPLQIEDPKYGIIVPVRAFGQYGFRISEARIFLEELIGNARVFGIEKVNAYFKAKIMSRMTNIISDKITKDQISVLNINSQLVEISEYCKQRLSSDMSRYGLELMEFDVMSINAKEDDYSFQELKRAKETAAKMKIVGRDVYQMERSFDVLDAAAANEGMGGAVLGTGLGVGMGAGIGATMGSQMGQVAQQVNVNPISQPSATPPPLPRNEVYYVAVNGVQQGPLDSTQVAELIKNGIVQRDTLCWKQGMANWAHADAFNELLGAFATPPPLV